MYTSRALAFVEAGVVAHVDAAHGLTDAGQVHARAALNDDGDCHDEPTDCFSDCDLTAALAAKSKKLNKVVATVVSTPIAYFLQFAADFWIVVPATAGELPPWASHAAMPQSMSVLERTTRLRN